MMTLTQNERLMLTCLFSLMKGQRLIMDQAGIEEPNEENDIPSAKQCRNAIEILRCGYEVLYDEPLLRPTMHFKEKEMGKKDGQFVMNVFHMFDDISRYLEENSQDEEVRNHQHSKFDGFDKNNDSQCYDFARFWTETLEWHADLVAKRREELSGEVRNDPFNSHSGATRKIYEIMLEEWQEQTPLTTHEKVMAVLNAPENRNK